MGEQALSAGLDNLFDVTGKVIVITGATGALGGAAARGLAKRGAKLVISGGNAASLSALAAELDARIAWSRLSTDRYAR